MLCECRPCLICRANYLLVWSMYLLCNSLTILDQLSTHHSRVSAITFCDTSCLLAVCGPSVTDFGQVKHNGGLKLTVWKVIDKKPFFEFMTSSETFSAVSPNMPIRSTICERIIKRCNSYVFSIFTYFAYHFRNNMIRSYFNSLSSSVEVSPLYLYGHRLRFSHCGDQVSMLSSIGSLSIWSIDGI